MIDVKIFKKIIIVLIVLIVGLALAGLFYYERNIFRSEHIRFEITAPDSVSVGEEVEYILRYRNNSDTRLEEVVLLFEYPEGAIVIEEEEEEEIEEEVEVVEVDEDMEENEIEQEVREVEEEAEEDVIIKRGDFRREVRVGELNPGEEKTTVFRARLVGKENDSLEASAQIRYVPRNLATRFDSSRTHVTQISSVPINFDLQMPSTINPDREENIRVNFSSEVDYPLTDLEVRLNYPSGFHFIRSTPQTEGRENNRWHWPVLNRGDSATINIDGALRGDPGSSKIFSATLGIVVGERFIPLKEATRGTSVARSNILMRAQVNGEEDYVATPGELLHYEIAFLNIGQETIENLYMLVELDEEKLDFDTVEAVDGRFQEGTGSIIWSHTFDFDLLELEQGEGGRVEFWARAKESFAGEPKITVKATVERAIKVIETRLKKEMSFEQQLLWEDSPFGTSGPYPFEEGERSTYTVKWNAKNPFGDLEDVVVTTALPEGASLTGESVMEKGDISFNEEREEVKVQWGDLEEGEEMEAVFEVEITPDRDFSGSDAIIYETEIIAKDAQTGNPVVRVVPAVLSREIIL